MKTSCVAPNCLRPLHGKLNYCIYHYALVRRRGFLPVRTTRTKNEIRILGDYCEMDLYNNKGIITGICKFDLCDLEFVKSRKWGKGSHGYVHDNKKVPMHRFFLQPKYGFETDHINNDRTDNRRDNLREATHKENSINRKGWAKSGFKGVYQEWNRFESRIIIDGKKVYLGRFATKEEASEAYIKAADQFGEFKNLDMRKPAQ